MKKLRDFYLIAGLAALAFALLTKHIRGITVSDFIQGFCYGLALAMLLAGLITSTIPHFYRNDKKKALSPEVKSETTEHLPEDRESGESGTSCTL